MKKFLSFITLLLAFVLIFSGCDNQVIDGSLSSSNITSDAATDPVTLPGTDDTTATPETSGTPVVPEIVFATKGKVNFALVKPQAASEAEKNAFDNLYEQLIAIFGGSIKRTTDAQYAGNYYNASSLEVTVGNVQNYPELAKMQKKLKASQYGVGFIDNKLVIASASDTGIKAGVNAFLKYVREHLAGDGSLSLPSIFLIIGEGATSDLEQFDGVPDFPGGTKMVVSDCADGYMQLTVSGTTSEMFTEYRTSLSSAGFTLHAENNMADNLFVTYTKSSQIVHAYYTPHSGETRIIAALSGNLPSTTVPTYTKVRDISVTLFGVGGALGCMLQLEDGSFVIVDGGNNTDADATGIYNKMSDLAPDPNKIIIRAWVITHAHSDHYGAFNNFSSKYASSSKVTVESIIFNLCDTAEQTQYLSGTSGFNSIRKTIKNSYPFATIYKALTGQVFHFAGADMEVLNCMSDFLPQVIGLEMSGADLENADGNIQSLVVRFKTKTQSVMVTGDVSKVSVDEMVKRFTDYLKTDIMTVPHHGWNQNRYRARNGTIDFYFYVNPTVVLWPDNKGTSKLAWNGKAGGDWEANYYLVNKLNVKEVIWGSTTTTIVLPYNP